jgi:hypothetical protein
LSNRLQLLVVGLLLDVQRGREGRLLHDELLLQRHRAHQWA